MMLILAAREIQYGAPLSSYEGKFPSRRVVVVRQAAVRGAAVACSWCMDGMADGDWVQPQALCLWSNKAVLSWKLNVQLPGDSPPRPLWVGGWVGVHGGCVTWRPSPHQDATRWRIRGILEAPVTTTACSFPHIIATKSRKEEAGASSKQALPDDYKLGHIYCPP